MRIVIFSRRTDDRAPPRFRPSRKHGSSKLQITHTPQNRADRQNRSKQEVGRKKQEARSKNKRTKEQSERPVSGSDTAAQCSLMRDGSLALALASGTMDCSFWRSVRQI